MSNVSIFLASSIREFADERSELMAFVYDIADIVDEHDIYLDLFVCEYADNAIQSRRTQDVYNESIRKPCDIFFGIFGKRAGQYTIEELVVAQETYAQHNKPHMLVSMSIDNTDSDHSLATLCDILDHDDAITKMTFGDVLELKLQLLYALQCTVPQMQLAMDNADIKLYGRRIIKQVNKVLYNDILSMLVLT